jgi:hypothetical protein
MERSRQKVGIFWYFRVLSGRSKGSKGSRSSKGLVLKAVPVVLCALALSSAIATAQTKVDPLPEKPPSQIAPAIASLLQPSGIKAIVGGATLDIWWAQAIALSGDGPGWSNVESGTLVGAMRISGPYKEIRGKVVGPGVYTLRYGLQPQNGDHLGISAFREFLVLSPVVVDTDPKVLGFDGVVALSKQVIGTSHPAAMSIDPPEEAPGALLSTYKNDSGHDGIVFEVPRSLNGKAAGTVKFGLIVSGTIVH